MRYERGSPILGADPRTGLQRPLHDPHRVGRDVERAGIVLHQAELAEAVGVDVCLWRNIRKPVAGVGKVKPCSTKII